MAKVRQEIEQEQAEKRLAKILRPHFRKQHNRIISTIADFDELIPEVALAAVDVDADTQALIEAIEEDILFIVAAGALGEFSNLSMPIEPNKMVDFRKVGLPQLIKRAVGAAAKRIMQADFWRGIQENVQAFVGRLIGRVAGLPKDEAKKEIGKALKKAAKVRAEAVATAEATGALNAGRAASIEAGELAGLSIGKAWVTVGDDRVRETHTSVGGSIVAVSANFLVGGHEAAHPGDPNLPAKERARCRCWVEARVLRPEGN